jgi:hypothetical protein
LSTLGIAISELIFEPSSLYRKLLTKHLHLLINWSGAAGNKAGTLWVKNSLNNNCLYDHSYVCDIHEVYKEMFICAGDCTSEGISETYLSSLLLFESFW